jgi:hypothetical protein
MNSGLCTIKENWVKLKTPYIMSLSKKGKGNSECRIFQEKWTERFMLICSESIAALKECNTVRHYSLKHKATYKSCVSALKRGLQSQQNALRKQSNDSSSAL